MKTDYVKYLQTIKKYNPLDNPIIELSFELSYEYEVLTIFNTLYEIGYTDFTKIEFEFIENIGTSNIYKCSGIVSTHMDIHETRDFLEWRKEYFNAKKNIDNLSDGETAKPKLKKIPESNKLKKIMMWIGIIGSVIFVFSHINALIYYDELYYYLFDSSKTECKNNYELFVLNYNFWLIFLGWFLLIPFFIYLRIKTDRFRMFIRRRFAQLEQEKFIGVDSDIDNELENEKNKVNITDIKEKYQRLKEKMPDWYSDKAFKFYYRDVYLLDKKLFDF